MELKKIKKPLEEKQKRIMRFVLGTLVVVLTLAYFFKVTFGVVSNENIAYLVIGYIASNAQNVISYYFGGNEKPEEKDKEKEHKVELDPKIN